MKFIDEAKITVSAGKGGAGCKHFRREKYVPYGGPDGGNGGRGGSVIIRADRNKHTLLDFRFRPEWRAKDGASGEGSLRDGADGEDLVIQAPIGTQVFTEVNGEKTLCADLTEHHQLFTLAKGGIGGKGNSFFKSSTNQAPERTQPGKPGEHGTFTLSLKLLADVGLVGLPNAGKSTFISRISAAKPKIADYPFTTLTPNLGVVQAKGGNSFVVADVPGLIPGAHTGRGLGTTFLKHLERTRVLLHLVDVNPPSFDDGTYDPFECLHTIEQELELFSQQLADLPKVVLFTKIDTVTDPTVITTLEDQAKQRGYQSFSISSVSGKGLETCLDYISTKFLQDSTGQAKEQNGTEGQAAANG